MNPGDVGRDVAVRRTRDPPPIVLGKLWQPEPRPTVQANVDNERLVLSAEKEIVLNCGAASLTLTRAGKILLRGAYILSRSRGANRIKGGSVQIN